MALWLFLNLLGFILLKMSDLLLQHCATILGRLKPTVRLFFNFDDKLIDSN